MCQVSENLCNGPLITHPALDKYLPSKMRQKKLGHTLMRYLAREIMCSRVCDNEANLVVFKMRGVNYIQYLILIFLLSEGGYLFPTFSKMVWFALVFT